MDFRETITVNGCKVKLQPYTELKHSLLRKVDKDVDSFVKSNPELKFSDVPRSKKAEFWMDRARILWEPCPVFGDDGIPKGLPETHWDRKEQFFTKAFFENEDFEQSTLEKTQIFFLNQEFFL